MSAQARAKPAQGAVWKDYILGGTASVLACTFTNPLEVVKTRLQLQGELDPSAPKPYKGVADAFKKIWQTEGIRGIQAGLGPGYAFQVAMNGTRLGTFTVIKSLMGVGTPEDTSFFFIKNIAAGATAGVIAACLGSPFYLVKTRLQSQAGSKNLAVGHQYHYKGMFDGFRSIVRTEGVKGLARGMQGIALRVAFGSATQLSTYEQSKALVPRKGLLQNDMLAYFAASCISGLAVVTVMNPFDVMATRLYNQKIVDGKGALYTGPIDCLVKTVQAEGLRGIYKGYIVHWMRIGPHTTLTMVFWEHLRVLWREHVEK